MWHASRLAGRRKARGSRSVLWVPGHPKEQAVLTELQLPARVLAGLGGTQDWTSGEQPFAWPRNGICACLCHQAGA